MTTAQQWRARVLARRTSGPYTVLTVAAPAVAERCRPGHYASVAVPADSGLLLRRQTWIGASSASGRDGGAVELVIDTAEAGGARIAAVAPEQALDVIAPSGRPFSLPRNPVSAVLAGAGAAAAPVVWLAAELAARGSRGHVLYLPPAEPYGLLDARRLAGAVDTVAAGRVAEALAAAARSADVVYSAGSGPEVAQVAAAVGGTPHQAAIATHAVCAAGTCTACVVPVTGRDGVTRMVRACIEGAVFNADLVRWRDLGTIPADCEVPS